MVGLYGKIPHDDLVRPLGLNRSLTEVTHQVEKIQVNDKTLAATRALTEEGS